MDILQSKVLQALYQHGVECYPEEACGFIIENHKAIGGR